MAAGLLCGGEQQRRIVAVGSHGLVSFDLESQQTVRHNGSGERHLRIWDVGVDHFALQSIRGMSVRTFADPASAQLEIDLVGDSPALSGDISLLSLLDWAIPLWSADFIEIGEASVAHRSLTIDHWIADEAMDVPPGLMALPGSRHFVAFAGKGAGPWLIVDEHRVILREVPLGGGGRPDFIAIEAGMLVARFDELYLTDPTWGVLAATRLKNDRSGAHVGSGRWAGSWALLCWYGRVQGDAQSEWQAEGAALDVDPERLTVRRAAPFAAWPSDALVVGDTVYARLWGAADAIAASKLISVEWPRFPVRPPGARAWF